MHAPPVERCDHGVTKWRLSDSWTDTGGCRWHEDECKCGMKRRRRIRQSASFIGGLIGTNVTR